MNNFSSTFLGSRAGPMNLTDRKQSNRKIYTNFNYIFFTCAWESSQEKLRPKETELNAYILSWTNSEL